MEVIVFAADASAVDSAIDANNLAVELHTVDLDGCADKTMGIRVQVVNSNLVYSGLTVNNTESETCLDFHDCLCSFLLEAAVLEVQEAALDCYCLFHGHLMPAFLAVSVSNLVSMNPQSSADLQPI